MAKRRYNAKKIAQTPSLKRKIAELLAEFSDRDPDLSIYNLLIYGHRGYISYHEDDLCKLFDKLFTQQLANFNEQKDKIDQELSGTISSWRREGHERELVKMKEYITLFQKVADEIFEEKILR